MRLPLSLDSIIVPSSRRYMLLPLLLLSSHHFQIFSFKFNNRPGFAEPKSFASFSCSRSHTNPNPPLFRIRLDENDDGKSSIRPATWAQVCRQTPRPCVLLAHAASDRSRARISPKGNEIKKKICIPKLSRLVLSRPSASASASASVSFPCDATAHSSSSPSSCGASGGQPATGRSLIETGRAVAHLNLNGGRYYCDDGGH